MEGHGVPYQRAGAVMVVCVADGGSPRTASLFATLLPQVMHAHVAYFPVFKVANTMQYVWRRPILMCHLLSIARRALGGLIITMNYYRRRYIRWINNYCYNELISQEVHSVD